MMVRARIMISSATPAALIVDFMVLTLCVATDRRKWEWSLSRLTEDSATLQQLALPRGGNLERHCDAHGADAARARR